LLFTEPAVKFPFEIVAYDEFSDHLASDVTVSVSPLLKLATALYVVEVLSLMSLGPLIDMPVSVTASAAEAIANPHMNMKAMTTIHSSNL
jgi:hypothetical protein